MTANEIVRSWKDEDFQSSYRGAETAFMPSNPAGLIELSDEELLDVSGVSGELCRQVASAVASAISGGLLSLAVTVSAITIYSAVAGCFND